MPQALRSPGFTMNIPVHGLMRYYHSFRNVIPHKEVGSPRVTHPSAMHPLLGTSDLHVLGTPPAFILSQDQTLMFNLYAHHRPSGRSGYLLLLVDLVSRLGQLKGFCSLYPTFKDARITPTRSLPLAHRCCSSYP